MGLFTVIPPRRCSTIDNDFNANPAGLMEEDEDDE
jgi:hypothetical protein